jgi:hypothetical protein
VWYELDLLSRLMPPLGAPGSTALCSDLDPMLSRGRVDASPETSYAEDDRPRQEVRMCSIMGASATGASGFRTSPVKGKSLVPLPTAKTIAFKDYTSFLTPSI